MERICLLFISIVTISFLFISQNTFADSNDMHFDIVSLHNQNAAFQDEYNRTVILHGLNEMNKQAPYRPDAIGFDLNSIQFFNTYGFNVVRLGVFWAAIEPIPYVYNFEYLKKIKETIDLLAEHGIYTLLDIHQDGYSSKYNNGFGEPIWASLSPSEKGTKPGFPVNLFGGQEGISLVTDQNFESFWLNQAGPGGRYLQQSYFDMAKILSRFFLNTKGLMGYDIMNEPFPGVTWPTCYDEKTKFSAGCLAFDTGVLSPFYSSFVSEIRAIDKNHILFFEPNVFFDSGTPTFVVAPKDNNIGFSFHNYDTTNPKQVFDYVRQFVMTNAAVPFMTEFGAALADTSQLTQVVEMADQEQLSWIEWAYTNNPGFKFARFPDVPEDQRDQGIVYDATLPLQGSNVKWDRLHVLSRAYPQVVAGKIRNYQFDSTTKIFTLTFDIKNTAGQPISSNPYSKIFIPAFIYPEGYKVKIQGAIAVKVPNKHALILKNNNEANSVELSIFPG